MSVPVESRTWPGRQVLLTELETGRTATIVSLGGGAGAQHRLRLLGLLEGQRVQKVSRIGKLGPIVVLVDRTQVAVGYGMAKRIIVQISI